MAARPEADRLRERRRQLDLRTARSSPARRCSTPSGAINPFIIFLAVPALFAAVAAAWRGARPLAALGAAWCVGTFLPLAFEAQVLDRISYLYYMLIVMPGIYIVVAR